MKTYISVLVLGLVLVSCNSGKKTNGSYSAIDKSEAKTSHPGKALLENNCYICHSATATENDRIGPPMIAIKKHYITDDTTKEEFIAAMQTWIKNPNEADAKMKGAVKRFGLMPKQHYPEETIAKIAEYMFDFEIEKPDWFENHYTNKNGNHKGKGNGNKKGNAYNVNKIKKGEQQRFENLAYAERGLKYALGTKAVLGKNLMSTLQQKGTIAALAFCNERAYPLTDSMSLAHNATIKRVSDKPRNSNNQASNDELQYIATFKNIIANNEEAKPIVKETDTNVNVYYPITANTMCLQCHGKPNENIDIATLTKLNRLYPKDKAIGYKTDEVRGIWSVVFDK